jgi:hypothetical protein
MGGKLSLDTQRQSDQEFCCINQIFSTFKSLFGSAFSPVKYWNLNTKRVLCQRHILKTVITLQHCCKHFPEKDSPQAEICSYNIRQNILSIIKVFLRGQAFAFDPYSYITKPFLQNIRFFPDSISVLVEKQTSDRKHRTGLCMHVSPVRHSPTHPPTLGPLELTFLYISCCFLFSHACQPHRNDWPSPVCTCPTLKCENITQWPVTTILFSVHSLTDNSTFSVSYNLAATLPSAFRY